MMISLHYLFLKMQAVLLLVFGHRARALQRFDRMLDLRPMDAYALASRAHLQAQDEKFDAAIATLQQLTAARPLDAPAWFNLGYVMQKAGRQEEAEAVFRKAIAVEPDMDRAWYGLALALMHRCEFHGAIEALKKNTGLQPMSPYGWYQLARVYQELGQPDEAQKVIAHLRQFEPKVAAQFERKAQLASSSGVSHAAC